MLEINAKDFKLKKSVKRDYKKTFWKENDRVSDEDKKLLNNIIGYNNDLWKLVKDNGINLETLTLTKIDSGFENNIPGYIGKFSGDLIINFKGSFVIANILYFNIWTERVDTTGFW
jgi:hypothetical protein